jgi:hypothetical protein
VSFFPTFKHKKVGKNGTKTIMTSCLDMPRGGMPRGDELHPGATVGTMTCVPFTHTERRKEKIVCNPGNLHDSIEGPFYIIISCEND